MSSGSGSGTPASSAASATVSTLSRRTWKLPGMLFTLERVSEPEQEPVTLAEMIQHLREFTSLSEAGQEQLQALITAGREWVEEYCSVALVDQTWRLTIDGYTGAGLAGCGFWPASAAMLHAGPYDILLRRFPILGINSFVTADAAGIETEIDVTSFALCEAQSKWPRLAPFNGSAFASGALKVEFRAGFVDLTSSPQDSMALVPARYRHAIKLWAEAHYDRDEKMMEKLIAAAENLLKPERADLGIA